MRRTITWILGTITLIPFFSYAQNGSKLEITGNLKWLLENETLVLSMLSGSQGNFSETVVDTAIAREGKFFLTTHVIEGPRFFFLNFKKHPSRFMHLFVDNEKVRIEDGDYSESELPKQGYITQYLKITGSKTADVFKTFFPLSTLSTYYETGIQNLIKKIEDSIGFDRRLIEGILLARNSYLKTLLFQLTLLANEKDLALYIPEYAVIYYRFIGKEPSLRELYEKLNEQARNSYYGKMMKQFLSSCIGQMAPDFNVTGPDGRLDKLSNVAGNGKMTILFFWSTEAPRGDMILELSAHFREFSSKGLNIVSIYTGTDSIAWKTNIDHDRLPWYHAADFKGKWDGIAGMYSFTSEVEPFTILLDEHGRISNWLAQGAVLKYYLQKTFE
jgi:peroxiredoxin